MQHPKREKKPSKRAERKIRQASDEIAEIWSGFDDDLGNIDVLGSYRGTPQDYSLHPVQDADDL